MTQLTLKRSEIQKKDCWDLSPLFAGEPEWEALFTEIENSMSRYNTFKGTLHESFEKFRTAIEFDADISRKLDRLYTYAHLKNDEDKANQHNLSLYERALNLYTRCSELSSFMTPEIQSLPDDVMARYKSDKSMQDYSFFFEKILRYKPHTLSPEIEHIMATTTEIAQAPSQIFSQLDNADLTFGTIEDENGKVSELTHGNFSSFLINRSRDVRKKAFFTYYDSYEKHKNTIAAALSFSNKKDFFYSRTRKFANCRAASLFSDNVPEEVYDNLVRTVRNNTGPLFKYLRFRKEALGLDELHFYDTYVPISGDADFHVSYEEAVEICLSALVSLGEEYGSVLKAGLLGGWVDRYENKGKRSGAYSSGCYDSAPYILMNYRDDNINSLYTLMHEAGHSMHSWYSKKNQPYIKHGYTIFVAEVASTFNETLLSHYLLNKYADDPKMKFFIINREIDNIRATLFRQTMFAEFEKITHSIIEANRPLTLDVITAEYKTLLETYFGDTLVIDEPLYLEALRIPHFYSPFYVYKYATGLSAAIALADAVLTEGEAARKRYLSFLGLGGSAFPLDQLSEAGVDMRSPQPIEKAIKHFEKLVDELIKAYNEI
ncbi:MAG: oligoendopeptidase F [Leptospirales bacterium]|nr:oligoendopeptidase F [Leptospirales bacterium]